MADVKRPVLLNSDLSESMILYPSKAHLTLNLNGVSTCQLNMAKWSDSLTQIRMHSWIKIYNQNGFVGIFRRTSANKNVPSDYTIQLRHGIDILQDSLWMTEMDFSGSTTSFLTALLNQQTALINGVKPWVLGTCEDTSTVQKKISYNNLLELITGMEDPAGDYYFTYDQTDFPWVLNYVRKSTEPECEFRLSRNLTKVRISENDSELCTRLILNINQMVTITDQDAGDSRQENQSTKTVYNNTAAQAVYGIITKTTDIDLADHPEGAAAFAQKFLKDRSAPLLQIQADGYDLKSVTGFDWDETQLGKLCQVAVPDYDTAYTERVVTVQYPDLLGQPCTVSVSLANALPKLTHSSTSTQREARETAREQREQERETQTIKSTSELNLIRTDYSGDVFRQAGLVIDPSGVLIFAREGLFDTKFSQIDVRADQITSYVGMTDQNKGENLYSKITQNANSITAEVGRAQQAEGAITTRVTLTENSITAEVGRAQQAEGAITTRVTLTENSIQAQAEQIKLNADKIEATAQKIDLYAETWADEVSTVTLRSQSVSTGEVYADDIETGHIYTDTLTMGSNAAAWHSISIDGTKAADFLGTADVNFDRAAARKEGADSVTLSSGGWQSGGRNIVSATNGQSLTVNLPSFTSNQTEWNSSHKKTVNFSTASVSVPLSSVTVDASGLYTDAYNAGVADGKAACGVAVNTANKTVYVTTSTTKSVVVSAVAEISYSSSTHKYTAIGRAKAGGRAMDYASTVSGTEAYQAGVDSVDTQSYYDSGFTAGWQGYYNASGWNRNSDGQVLIPSSSGSGSEVWFNLADELPGISFTWWNPAKGVAGVYFYIWGKYYGTSHEIPPGWM